MYSLADRTYRVPTRGDARGRHGGAVEAHRVARGSAPHPDRSRHPARWRAAPARQASFRGWVEQVRGTLAEGGVSSYFSVQSNGVLIDDEWIDLFAGLSVNVGLSIDGPKRFHDRHRVDHQGGGSFDAVVTAIRRLQAHPEGAQDLRERARRDRPRTSHLGRCSSYGGSSTSRAWISTSPTQNHEHRPATGAMSYGDWMIEFFELWFEQNRPDRHVR